jgi:hypothetical protein
MDKERRKWISAGGGAAAMATLFASAAPSSKAQSIISADDVAYQQDDPNAVVRTAQDKLRERVTLEDFGAVGNALTDDTAAVVAAIQHLVAKGGGTIWLLAKEYYLHDAVTIPEGVDIEFAGENGRRSVFRTRNHGLPAFRYVRSAATAQSASVLTFRNLTLQELGHAKTAGGAAIQFWGYSQLYHNNVLNCFDCTFIGYDSAVRTRFVGKARFQGCYYWNNNIGHTMDRDSSFHYFSECLALNNVSWIDADDARGLGQGQVVSDGISNTLIIDSCVSVNASGDDIRVNGWQSVYIAKGGCDGGSATGGAALRLSNVQDFSIEAMYLSSSSKLNGRAGLFLEDCSKGKISGCSFVSCDIGLLQTGPSPASVATLAGASTRIAVDGNTFRDNYRSDLRTNGYLRSSKIIANHFESDVARTGADYEVYVNEVNSVCNIVKMNTFHHGAYTITSGAGSIIGDNIFDAP